MQALDAKDSRIKWEFETELWVDLLGDMTGVFLVGLGLSGWETKLLAMVASASTPPTSLVYMLYLVVCSLLSLGHGRCMMTFSCVRAWQANC